MKLKYQFIPHTPNVEDYSLICALSKHNINNEYETIFEALDNEGIKYLVHYNQIPMIIDLVDNGFIIFKKGKNRLHFAPIKDKVYYDKKDYRNQLSIIALIEIKKDL